MTNVSVTPSKRLDIDTHELVVIDATAKEEELESASPASTGVLKELALARWRGLPTEVRGRQTSSR
jgi:hypothetical protein